MYLQDLGASAGDREQKRERGARRPLSLVLKRAVRGAVFARRSAARESAATGGEMSANAGRNSENPTEHLAAKYN